MSFGTDQCFERKGRRRGIGDRPDVVMKGMDQFEVRAHLPGELVEETARVPLCQNPGGSAGLAPVILLAFEAAEDPKALGKDGTSQMGSEIMKSVLREAGLTLLASAIEADGLARKPLAPVEVGRVEAPLVSPLLRDEVDDRPLKVSVLRRSSERENLDLLDDAGVDRRAAGAEGGGCEVRAIHQEEVLVRPRAEAREFRETLGGPGRRDAGRRFYEIEHVEPPEGSVLQVFRAVVRRKTRLLSVHNYPLFWHNDSSH